MCRLLALLLTKYCHTLSLEGPAPIFRASSRSWFRTDSFSSSGNKAGTIPVKGENDQTTGGFKKDTHTVSSKVLVNQPEVSMLLISSKKPSSATWPSVKRKTVFLSSMPSFKYSAFRSSRRFDSLYPLLSVISNTWKIQIPLQIARELFLNIVMLFFNLSDS